MAHRLVRLYFRGKWPEPGYDTDHINLDKADNRLCNLRHATRSQNQANTLAQANNKSGLKGASFHKPIGKWQAQIMVKGKKLRLGYFKTKFRSIRESGMSRHGRLKEKSNDNTQATKRGYHANLNGEGRWPGGGCDPSRFANAT
jgi:hypothetical protein